MASLACMMGVERGPIYFDARTDQDAQHSLLTVLMILT